ncbi:MAG: hypothetical protein PHT07_17955 [Paludibacter sp.]|nr:hypothetical protein [Paludibacter sp.]
MELGAFSVSLSVSDLNASKVFYEKLGFESVSGGVNVDYLYMKKGNSIIGLFQDDILTGNCMTLNPVWDENLHNINKFKDYSKIRKSLSDKGIKIEKENSLQEPEADSFVITDPDGNRILIAQQGL